MTPILAFWIFAILFLIATLVATIAIARALALGAENESLRQALIRSHARSTT